MTCGPWIAGTALPVPVGLLNELSPGCPLILVGVPTDVPLGFAERAIPPLDGLPAAPPHAAAATRMAMMTTAFFIRRPPVFVLRSELSDQTLDVAARNICQRAAGQESRHRRRRAPGALGRELQRGYRGQGRFGRPQRRRQDQPAEGPGRGRRSSRGPGLAAGHARLRTAETAGAGRGVPQPPSPHTVRAWPRRRRRSSGRPPPKARTRSFARGSRRVLRG